MRKLFAVAVLAVAMGGCGRSFPAQGVVHVRAPLPRVADTVMVAHDFDRASVAVSYPVGVHYAPALTDRLSD